MPECVCGAELRTALRQPGECSNRLTEHYRCPDCPRSGFRVLGVNGSKVRDGGPAFDGGAA